MRGFIFVLAIILAPTAYAQTPSNVFAAGATFNYNAQPEIAGSALYARLILAGSGTYAFTVVDVLPNSTHPFTVTSNFSIGVSQKLFTLWKVPIFTPSGAGVSYTGANTGWSWNSGILADVRIKKSNWRIFPVVRFSKSNVSNGSGAQALIGVMFGYAR